MEIKTLLDNWSKNRTIVIVTLIFVYPLGVYLMWKGEHFNKDQRWFITLIMIVWTLYLGGQGSNDSYSDSGCSETFYQNGCTYYRDSSCNVIAQSCD